MYSRMKNLLRSNFIGASHEGRGTYLSSSTDQNEIIIGGSNDINEDDDDNGGCGDGMATTTQ